MASVEILRMKEEDRINIAAIVSDPKFISMFQLFDNLRAKYIVTLANENSREMDSSYRGGAMALTALKSAIKGELDSFQAQIREDIEKSKCLDMVGW